LVIENAAHAMTPNDERPVLARRAGRYREAPPLPALRAHFRCVWTNALAAPRPTRIAVVPDGCVDLLWRDGRFVVVGPDVTAATPVLSPGSTVVGLRFRPGAAATWLRLPLGEIVGREVAMAALWGPDADRVADRLAAASTASAQALILQQAMAERATALDAPPPAAAAIFAHLRGNAADDGGAIAALRARLDTSERTLRRWSHAYFGYGAKTLHRILRFQRFQDLARANADDPLAGLAVAAGYADQAHLGREIQALCGMTATELVRQLSG
jgi:AraC-like DNA-binding protein